MWRTRARACALTQLICFAINKRPILFVLVLINEQINCASWQPNTRSNQFHIHFAIEYGRLAPIDPLVYVFEFSCWRSIDRRSRRRRHGVPQLFASLNFNLNWNSDPIMISIFFYVFKYFKPNHFEHVSQKLPNIVLVDQLIASVKHIYYVNAFQLNRRLYLQKMWQTLCLIVQLTTKMDALKRYLSLSIFALDFHAIHFVKCVQHKIGAEFYVKIQWNE